MPVSVSDLISKTNCLMELNLEKWMIFTNVWNKPCLPGILIDDVSDHLPVFVLSDIYLPRPCNSSNTSVGHRSSANLNYFQAAIQTESWPMFTTKTIPTKHIILLLTFLVCYMINISHLSLIGPRKILHFNLGWPRYFQILSFQTKTV